MTPETTYAEWRSTLKKPDDSIFYYHKSLDRILLGLAIFVISTRPLLPKLGKAEMLGILHLQVPDLITYWIDGNDDAFASLFPMVMTVAEGYIPASIAAEKQYPSRKKSIRTIAYMLANACGAAGDMKPELADELLDDLETDGQQIYSDKIKKYGERLLFLTQRHGIDIPVSEFTRLNGW